MKTRAEKVVYVYADADLDFETVAEHLDVVQSTFYDLHIALITPTAPYGKPYDFCSWQIRWRPYPPPLQLPVSHELRTQ